MTGKKYDSNKPPLFQGCLMYFPNALEAVAHVSAYGAKKYGVSFAEKNWQELPDAYNRYTDGMVRHLLAEAIYPWDNESKLMHAAHCAWNALARLELLLNEKVDVHNPTHDTPEELF